MRKFLSIINEITNDAINNIAYFLKNNLMKFAGALNLIEPYVMYLIGQNVALNRGQLAVGGEIFVPLIFVVVIYYIRGTANKLRKGTTIPIPEIRFTEVDDDGEVSVDYKRIQEMLLYMADLEDWMERKGIL